MNEIRLQLALAKAGLASRRHAEELIVAGRVSVNGRVVTELGSKVDPVSDRVTVDGNPVLREAPAYYLMNKPKGYVTTADDPEGRLTVFSLMKNSSVRLFSVGRLDYNTEGALLLTNDGELAHALMHPSRGVAKVYHAKFRGLVEKEQLTMLRRGVDLPPARPLDKDGKPLPTMKGSDKPERSAPADVTVINTTGRHSWLQFILHEGKNRQIHRMAEAVGSSLLKLLRVEYAGLALMDLPTGEYRPLQTREVLELRQSVGLRPFAAQEGPVKPRVKVEEDEGGETAESPGGARRGREESVGRPSRPWQPAPMRARPDRGTSGSYGQAPTGPRRSEWGQDRAPSPREGGERERPAFESRERSSYGAGGRGGAAIRPRPAAWSQDRPGARDGGEQRERSSYGAADRGAAPGRSPRPAWGQDRPAGRDGGEQRSRPSYGATERGGAPGRPRRAEWGQDRPNNRDGGEQRERPAFGASDRGPARSPRPTWSQDRPNNRDGGEQRDRPAFGGGDRGPARSSRPAWGQDRPNNREGGEQRDRPAFGAGDRGPARSPRPAWGQDRPSSRDGEQRDRPAFAGGERGAAPRSPRPAWSQDRPQSRSGGDQRTRPAGGAAGRSDLPPRPRRPEWSQDRPAAREGGEQRDRSGPPPRTHRAAPVRRPDTRSELPHDWPPR